LEKLIPVTRMDCPTCVLTLEKAVQQVPGVTKAQGNYLRKVIRVEYAEPATLAQIEKAIEELGYDIAYKKYPSPLERLRGLFSKGETKAIQSIRDEDFPEKVLHASGTAAVLFSSAGCPACMTLKPKLIELAERAKGTRFYEMDVTQTETWKEYTVMGIPTVLVFKDGKQVQRFGAMLNVEELSKVVA
jgi:copper chaperone CopZ